jgi:hypothetical protein
MGVPLLVPPNNQAAKMLYNDTFLKYGTQNKMNLNSNQEDMKTNQNINFLRKIFITVF